MRRRRRLVSIVLLQTVFFTSFARLPVCAEPPPEPHRCIYPEQRRIEYRCPHGMCRLPPTNCIVPPATVKSPMKEREVYLLSLDEAIQLALCNAEVIRVLLGQTAASSGRTIYDAAISNTQVDVARGRFDPSIDLQNTYLHTEQPFGIPDLVDPIGARVDAFDVDAYNLGLGISQTKSSGGTGRLGVNVDPNGSNNPLQVLNPQTPSSVELSYTQPLLRGRGVDVNLAPIVIARIDTERSFYQLKDSVQELIRSVIEGYWGMVFARVNVWARRQQVEQLQFAFDAFNAQKLAGRGDLGDTVLAALSLANFRATLISAEAELVNREAAFRNVLGLCPTDEIHLVPATAPVREEVDQDWQSLLDVALQHRPDIIELKLAVEAACQQVLIAHNGAKPQLDVVALGRNNGLGGRGPAGIVAGQAFQFTDVQVGLNLTTPVFLRSDRANLRQQELLLARDRANLRQLVHAATHDLAQNIRNLDQFFAQYEAFKTVRRAARDTLDRQIDLFRAGGLPTERITYLEVLQAVTDWGNAVSSEAQALTQYNAELANTERQIGTILEQHGIQFFEEHYASKGPFPICVGKECYPQAMPLGRQQQRYDVTGEPAEEDFDLSDVPGAGRGRRRNDERGERDDGDEKDQKDDRDGLEETRSDSGSMSALGRPGAAAERGPRLRRAAPVAPAQPRRAN